MKQKKAQKPSSIEKVVVVPETGDGTAQHSSEFVFGILQVREIDISSIFSPLRQILKYQPRLNLAKYAEGVVLVHEEVVSSFYLRLSCS